MTDVHEPAIRSYNMSRIKCKDTKPELLVRKYLFSNGFRYRLHVKNLPGKPDIFIPKHKTAIFIHGCFWHGHEGCNYYKMPKTNSDFWKSKIDANTVRDKNVMQDLAAIHIKTIIIWECMLKPSRTKETLESLKNDHLA